MNQGSNLNSYINASNSNLSEKNTAENNLNDFLSRIRSVGSTQELKEAVNSFLYVNDLTVNEREDIMRIVELYGNDSDFYSLQVHLEEYLTRLLNDKTSKYEESVEEVNEVKQEAIDKVEEKLNDAGITITGDTNDLFDEISSSDDIDKINDNVDKVVDYMGDRKNNVNAEDIMNVNVSVDDIKQTIDGQNDTSKELLDTVLENQDQAYEKYTNNIEVNSDGDVVVRGNGSDQDAANYMAMMSSMLVSNQTSLSVGTNLDMKLIKNSPDSSDYKMIFGKFPSSKHPNEKIDPALLAQINNQSANYNPGTDYMGILSSVSPELATAIEISDHMLKEEGNFQMAINNGGTKHEIIFGMDKNFNEISESFQSSGAFMTNDIEENSIARITGATSGDQLVTLNSTLEIIKQNEIAKQEGNSLSNNLQYVKKMEQPVNDSEAANVTSTFLMVIAVAEVLLSLFYFLLLK